MEPTFHPASEADLETVLDLMHEFYAFSNFPFDRPKARSALLGLLRDQSLGLAWVIRAGATAVGYFVLVFGYSLEYHGRDAFVDEIYLQPQYRGRGLGEQALRFMEQVCRDLGIVALHLEVERSNEAPGALSAAGFLRP